MSDAGRRLTEGLLASFVTHPWRTLIATALLVVFAATQTIDPETGGSRLELDPSTDSLLPDHDEARRFLDWTKATFDSGETVLVGLVADDVFTTERLTRLKTLTDVLANLDEALYVSSLSTAVDIRGEAGTLHVEPFFDDVPNDPEDLAALRRRAVSDPIYGGNLVSKDGRVAVIAVQLLDIPESELLATQFDERVAEIVEAGRGDMEVWLTGGPHVKAEISRIMLADMALVLPLSWLLMGAIAAFTFRSLRGVLIPIAIVTIATIIALAFMAAIEGRMNQVTVAVPPILVVVGFAYAVHLLAAWVEALRTGVRDRFGAVIEALNEVSIPILFTGLTTAAGFLSLVSSPLGAVRQFGAYSAIGVVAATILSLTVVPATLRLLPLPKHLRSQPDARRFDAWLEAVAHLALRRRRAILWAGVGIAALALAGIPRIVVGTNMVSNLFEDNPTRRSFEAFNRALQGANGFRVVLDGERPEAFKEPENLEALDTLATWIESQPEVGGVTSIADYVKLMYRGVQDDDPAFERIPESRALVSQLLVLGENEELERFVDADYEVAAMSVRTSAFDSAALVDLVERIETRLEDLPPTLSARVTGTAVLVARTTDDIAVGQARSLVGAFVIIGGILSVLFTSLRAGAIALIPNVLPILVYFGILGWSGVTLNTSTGLVACVVLGIAVDDTIHLFAHFNAAAKRMADEAKGIVEAVVRVGRPVTMTTLALCIGFLCQLVSHQHNQLEFGVLAAATLAFAWAVDLTFTPAVAAGMRIVTLWDVITLDLGARPHSSIPLFRGLSERRAKIAALMMEIDRVEAGERLIRRGTAGTDLFVVIEGELEVSVGEGGERHVVRTIQRGEVVGEMGLVRGVRSANVDARSDVRLLRLSRADLERLERRYPRIAARLTRNLSTILADKLTELTDEHWELGREVRAATNGAGRSRWERPRPPPTAGS